MTSNRRHLMKRDMLDNERSSAISQDEGVEEKVSLSDRFGLWVSFHKCNKKQYMDMINHYVKKTGSKHSKEIIEKKALQWSIEKGDFSGRIAKQFITSLKSNK